MSHSSLTILPPAAVHPSRGACHFPASPQSPHSRPLLPTSQSLSRWIASLSLQSHPKKTIRDFSHSLYKVLKLCEVDVDSTLNTEGGMCSRTGCPKCVLIHERSRQNSELATTPPKAGFEITSNMYIYPVRRSKFIGAFWYVVQPRLITPSGKNIPKYDCLQEQLRS